MARAMTAELDIQFDGQVLDVDASDQDEAIVYPAQQCAQGFLDQLTAFADDLGAGARMAVCLPGFGDKKLYVNRVTVRLPDVICISGVDGDGMAFSHVCHHTQFSATLVSYRVS